MARLSDEQIMLRDTVEAWVREASPVAAFRALRDSGNPSGFESGALQTMAEMGWLGVVVPEACGGTALGYKSAGLILTELGRTLTASPLAAIFTAVSALALSGNEGQQARWLPAIATGEVVATVCVDEGPHHMPQTITCMARPDAGGWRIDGVKRFVPEGGAASVFIVAARISDDVAIDCVHLFVVEAAAVGVTCRARSMVDGRGYADIEFDNVYITEDACLDGGQKLFDLVLDHGRALAAAEMLGLVEQAFDLTVDYLKVRRQFGQPIGSFQALQHRAVNLYSHVSLLRAATEAALTALDESDAAAPKLVALAKATASDTGNLMGREMIQLHGGIGMTDEHDAGLYLKRARVLETQWGNGPFHRDRYGYLSGY